MQMDIFLWVHIVSCPWEYRIELHECIAQSGQMNVVQLFYLLQIRELEIKKKLNTCFSLLFYMGLCSRINLAGFNTGSVVSAAWTQNKKADGTQQNPSLEPVCPVLQGES